MVAQRTLITKEGAFYVGAPDSGVPWASSQSPMAALYIDMAMALGWFLVNIGSASYGLVKCRPFW